MPKIDYDIRSCFEYNSVFGFRSIFDVAEVLAVYEGRNDEEDWRWIVRHVDGRFAYIRAGCDYTGWDCQSWVDRVVFSDTPMTALIAAEEGDEAILKSLRDQLVHGKAQTWRERKDAEFGVTS